MVVVTAAVLGVVVIVVIILVVVDVADLLCDVYVVVLGLVVDVVEVDASVVVSFRHVKQQFTAACCPEQSTVRHVATLSPYSQPLN